MYTVRFVLVFIISYLLGSLSFAIITSKYIYGQDIRQFGSGNAGMTNVLRTYGKKAAAITLLGDMGKGALSVAAARLIFSVFLGDIRYLPTATNSFSIGPWELHYTVDLAFYSDVAVYVAVLGCLLGHLFPVFFSFKGGKGISVIFGSMLAATPIVTLCAFGVFVVIVAVFRIVSLASITAVCSYSIFMLAYFYFTGMFSLPNLAAAFTFPIVIIWSHRSNIKRLLNGTEYKFGQKKK